jgi:hypothetical protein
VEQKNLKNKKKSVSHIPFLSEESMEEATTKKLRLESSSLHRLLSFPIAIFQMLSLNFETLAADGYFWNSRTHRIQCFKCGRVEECIIKLQDLTTKQIISRHYDCTHPYDNDIPFSNATVLLNYEAHRLYTFYQKDWVCTFMNIAELAESGFYYIGSKDICKCFFCKLEVSEWVNGDSAKIEHRKWSPNCLFINEQYVPNLKLGDENIIEEIRPFSCAVNDTSHIGRLRFVAQDRERQTIHPDMGNFEVRVASFKNWPKDKIQKPSELAEAGFFYRGNGKDDSVFCFHCGGGLKEWEQEDKPWHLHAKWFSFCQYVRKKMDHN